MTDFGLAHMQQREGSLTLTGDLVDGHVEELRASVAPLGQLRARHGVFAVTGNHEYYSGADAWIAELTRLGARYLRNQRVAIGDGAANPAEAEHAHCLATDAAAERNRPLRRPRSIPDVAVGK